MAEKTYLLRMTEKEHKKLMELSKKSRQSVSQFVLSKTIDKNDDFNKKEVDSMKELIESEEYKQYLRHKFENRDKIPENAKTGI